MGYATPQASATANCGTYVPVAGPSRGDLVTPERSLEVMGASPDTVRRSTNSTPLMKGQECGVGNSNYDQGHDPMTASASGCVDQGHGSTEVASGTRPKARSQTAATQSYGCERSTGGTSVRSDSRKGGRERSQSRGRYLEASRTSNRDPTDSASCREWVSDGSYTSRERSTGGTSVRSDSRNGGRERSQSQGRDLVTSRTSNRDPTDSAVTNSSNAASNSSLPSHASTSWERIVVPSSAGVFNPQKEVSEYKMVQQEWMVQIKQSNCSESIKARDLDLVEGLEGAHILIAHFGEHQSLAVGQQCCEHLGPIREACGKDDGTSNPTSSKFSLKNGLLHRKVKQGNSTRVVICMPDIWLPAFIHHLHKVYHHPSLGASRRRFERFFYNRNADRMIKSYIQACDLCSLVRQRAPLKGSQAGR